jgi:biotin carboxyl carrier protein
MSKYIKFKFNDVLHEVQVHRDGDFLTLIKDNLSYHVELIPDDISKIIKPVRTVVKQDILKPKTQNTSPNPRQPGDNNCSELAPITGTIMEIKVETGQLVQIGDLIAIMEAMKMEIELFASVSGTVQSLYANPGDTVKEKQPLLNIS